MRPKANSNSISINVTIQLETSNAFNVLPACQLCIFHLSNVFILLKLISSGLDSISYSVYSVLFILPSIDGLLVLRSQLAYKQANPLQHSTSITNISHIRETQPPQTVVATSEQQQQKHQTHTQTTNRTVKYMARKSLRFATKGISKYRL